MEAGDERGEPQAIRPEDYHTLDYPTLDYPTLDYPTLAAVARLAGQVAHVPWFAALGEPLSPALRADAEAYLSALGFPDAHTAEVADWAEAEEAARNPEWNTAWWETEEQLRADLTAQACELTGEGELMAALTHVTASVSDVVQGAAARAATRAGIADQALIRAAAGAAIQGSFQAALVLAAAAEETHAFAIKFRLFEAGRWPLGIVGMTFSLF